METARDTAANLFLLNPNGIIFGRNAQLNIGGSFVASTANAIQFGDRGFFSATDPNAPPLLTVNPSAFLFNQTRAAAIENNSRADARPDPAGNSEYFGLNVPFGRSLLLVGGDIKANGGGIVAFGGRVDLAAVAGTGTVGLNVNGDKLSLNVPDDLPRADVSLNNGAGFIVYAGGGGDIAITAKDINIDNSSLTAGILSDFGSEGAQAGDITLNATSLFVNNSGVISNTTFGLGNAGTINIVARDVVSINNGNGDSFIFNNVGEEAVGGTGGININTGSFFVKNGAQIQALTLGKGSAGNITITARDTVSFDGRGPNDSGPSAAATLVVQEAEGDAGDINITTGTLSLSNRAQLLSNTESRGNAGNINIEARDRVSLFNSALISEVSEEGGVGNGGDINIRTGTLLLKDGSALLADLENQGSAGNIKIEARDAVILEGRGPGAFSGSLQRGEIVSSQISATVDPRAVAIDTGGRAGSISISTDTLSVTDGGFVSVITFGRGDAGSIDLNAQKLSLGSGAQISASTFGTGNAGNLTVTNADLVELIGIGAEGYPSGLFAQVLPEASGTGGNLTVETKQLNIRDGAGVSVGSFGLGAAGNLNVTAHDLQLDNGTLEATTTTGDRGNINVRSRSIGMRRGSKITTDASGDASGGDINIDTEFLIAAPNEDNDIIANAARGTAGNIAITAQGVFGIQPRREPTPETNDITANSELGIDGTVQLNSPEVDPSRDVVELPTAPVDASALVASGCPSGAENRFAVTGRGGLPPAPGDKLAPDALLTDWANLPTSATANRATVETTTLKVANTTPHSLVEATSWQYDRHGAIILTSGDTASTSHLKATPSSCPSS